MDGTETFKGLGIIESNQIEYLFFEFSISEGYRMTTEDSYEYQIVFNTLSHEGELRYLYLRSIINNFLIRQMKDYKDPKIHIYESFIEPRLL
jgi:hypothetical protein